MMNKGRLREIKEVDITITPILSDKIDTDPVGWLEKQARAGMLLLAHADDVVLWGRVIVEEDNKLRLKFSSPTKTPLRNKTLIMARLFDDSQEIFLWQITEGKWQARHICDKKGETCRYFDEKQILWGDSVEKRVNGFVHLVEGAEGLRHAPPEELLADDLYEHKAALTVRHYLQEEHGWLRIAYSRLVSSPEEGGVA